MTFKLLDSKMKDKARYLTDSENKLSLPPEINLRRLLKHRLSSLRRKMKMLNMGACVLFDAVNIRYATGARNMQIFTSRNPSSRYVFIPLEGPVVLFEFAGCEHLAAETLVDEVRPSINASAVAAFGMQEEQAKKWAVEIIDLYQQYGNKGILGMETATLYHQRILEANGIVLEDAQKALELARAEKSEDEIQIIRHGLAATDKGVWALREQIKPGISENEIWSLLHQAIIAADGDYIETRLLSSGKRTNPWFQESSTKLIGEGELVGLDTDVVGLQGYYADYSRTFFCGNRKPTARQKDLYKIAYEQVCYNISILKPGLSFKEYSEKAWCIPDEFMNNRYFVLAHGVGMTGEYPYIFHFQDFPDGYDGLLQPGMTLCVESYIGGKNDCEGVKLEEQVLITEKGCECLSTFPYEETLL